LIEVCRFGTVVTGVSDAISVRIFLLGVWRRETIVVAVARFAILAGVVEEPVSIPIISDTVSVRICGRVERAVACIPPSIVVCVLLVLVGDLRAVIAGVTDTVSIAVFLRIVCCFRAVVELISDAVVVGVLPLLALVADAVVIRVFLVEIGYILAVIARIPDAVSVTVFLVFVFRAWTVVSAVDDAVPVKIPRSRQSVRLTGACRLRGCRLCCVINRGLITGF
jgi:hypothetical protein